MPPPAGPAAPASFAVRGHTGDNPGRFNRRIFRAVRAGPAGR
jgi:hypothetical protein